MGKKREPEPPPDPGIAGRFNVAREYQGLRDLDAAIERVITTRELRVLDSRALLEAEGGRLLHGRFQFDLCRREEF